MKSDADRCGESETFRRIDAAFRNGDLAALRAAGGDPDCVPNSPLPFIRTLLEIGADPNPKDHAGFPPLIAALSCSRPDTLDIIKLLLTFGADPNQRGINDYTPLHMAVSGGHLAAFKILLEAGADPRLRTRIDHCETPIEMAERVGLVEIAKLVAAYELRQGK